MPRLVFPSDPLVYQLDSNSVFKGQAGLQLLVYTDPAGTTLANIQTMADATVPNSALFVDANSQIPLFKGPDDGTDTLYIKPAGGTPQAVYARTDDRIDGIVSAVAAQDATVAAANKTARSFVKSFLFGVPF